MNEKLIQFLEDRGFTINNSMSTYIERWKSWYQGFVEGFHKYTVWNGLQHVEQRRMSMQLGKNMPENLANLLFNEKCEINIDNEEINEYVKKVMDGNNMYVKLNESQERKAALGTMAYIPYWTNEGIRINYITAENIIPLSWENGVIYELCVWSTQTVDGEDYIFVQLFYTNNGGTYVIENLLLKETAKGVAEIDYSDIPGYENIEPKVQTNSTIIPFVIDRLNIANNIDIDNPLGLSVFANAIDAMRLCDTVWDSLHNEFNLGKKRIMVAPEAINVRSGQPVFDPNDLIFYQLPEGISSEGKPFIQEIDMQLRVSDHESALQNALNIFSSLCGLGETFYRYNQGSIATATQIISENNQMFRTLKKHEQILEAVLVDLVRLIVDIAERHGEIVVGRTTDTIETENNDLGTDMDFKVSIKFDDSIIEDKEQEIKTMMAEVAAGLLKPEKYIMWRYGVTEEQVGDYLPGIIPGEKEEGMQ